MKRLPTFQKYIAVNMPTINRKVKRIHTQKYKHDNQSQEYYNTIGWKRLRKAYISEHPLCEECLKKGIIKPAKHVHHIKPFLKGLTDVEISNLFYDMNNLMSLCLECHKEKHRGN